MRKGCEAAAEVHPFRHCQFKENILPRPRVRNEYYDFGKISQVMYVKKFKTVLAKNINRAKRRIFYYCAWAYFFNVLD